MASIDKRKNGKWRARWREYPSGPQQARHFDRHKDAERFLVGIEHSLLAGTYLAPEVGRITVSEFAKEWMARRDWAPSTGDRYEREMRIHILPEFGSRPINSLRRPDIEKWAKGIGLRASTVHGIVATLKALLAAAVEDGRIATNPAHGARLPKVPRRQIEVIGAEDVWAMVQSAPEHMKAAVVLAAGSGLRQGELFGLTRQCVDLRRQRIRVERQLWTPRAGTPFLKEPKTNNSHRTVPLSASVIEAVADHIETHGVGPDGLIFHHNGEAISRPRGNQYMVRLRRKEGVPAGVSWHDLRHYHATVLLSEGVNPAKVAERLGHDLATLLKTYAHVLPADDERVRSIVDRALALSRPHLELAEDSLRTEAA